MEAKALKKHIRMSPRKMRLIADLVRGKNVNDALVILRFNPKHAAKEAEFVLRSAISNLNNKAMEIGERFHESNVFIKTIKVDNGPFFKRILPAPYGRAFKIRKRSNHLTIIVGTVKE